MNVISQVKRLLSRQATKSISGVPNYDDILFLSTGIPWTEEEHRMFLLGLQKLGKGDWRGISRNYVISRTPTQVASHAQKYFIRQCNVSRRKRRSSLFDIVADEVITVCCILMNTAFVSQKNFPFFHLVCFSGIPFFFLDYGRSFFLNIVHSL